MKHDRISIDELNVRQVPITELALLWPYNDPTHRNYHWLQRDLNVSPEALDQHVVLLSKHTLQEIHGRYSVSRGQHDYLPGLQAHIDTHNDDDLPYVISEVIVNHSLLEELSNVPLEFVVVVMGQQRPTQRTALLIHEAISGYLRHKSGVRVTFSHENIQHIQRYPH